MVGSTRNPLFTCNASSVALFAAALALGILQSNAPAQLTRLDEREAFSEDRKELFFSELRQDSGPAGEVYRALGVRFSGEAGSQPRARVIVVRNTIAGNTATVIRNEPVGESSADSALILGFAYPLRRAGLRIGNGGADTVATITALTPRGENLGSIQVTGIDPGNDPTEVELGPFVGLETDHPEGIATLVVEYDDETVEQLAELVLDYLTPRTFRTYIPQVAHGRAGGLQLRTSFQIKALLSATQRATVRFFGQSGEAMQVPVAGELTDSVTVDVLLVGGGVQFQTEGEVDAPRVGYACVESSLPVLATAIYTVESEGAGTASEAGISAVTPGFVHVTAVDVNPEAGRNVGVAVANLGEQETFVQFVLVGQDGLVPAGEPNFVSRTLAPGAQIALFGSQIYALLGGAGFRGSLVISSGEPTVVTSLRTVRGLPVSSLSSANTQQ